ncbi:MAG: hypothetical protein EBQ66_02655, partial [Flavobacteriia bacterium]|nr:hypothetical protein [Flavobacteriia bacterium]
SQGSGSQTFNYTGAVQTFTAPVTATYTLEAWGAKGGGGTNCYGAGGNGGYSKGSITLTAGQTIYIGVGQQGYQSSSATAFNGGGAGNANPGDPGYTGGGATHFATANGVLASLSGNQNSVLLVAGGGGGAAGGTCVCSYQGNGGVGGGSTGGTGVCSGNDCGYRPAGSGGTQAAGGTSQSPSIASAFGLGATSSTNTGDCIQGGGGGGGWYGGGAGGYAGGGGGGGSGYLNASLAVTQLTDGASSMPNPAGGLMTGNAGNGVAVISWVGVACQSALIPVSITINAPASPNVSGTTTINCGSSTVLTSSAGNSTAWYSAAVGGTLLGTGSTYTTPVLAAGTSVYAMAATIASGNQTFNYTGAQQTWTVPAGVTSITVDAQGAQGSNSSYGTGGNGGRVQTTLSVTPGATVYINVGQAGTISAGGWNGGGAPYACSCAGGGGGASDLRIGGTALTDRKIVAGGGGGAGYCWNYCSGDHGGAGGNLTGGVGLSGGMNIATYGGQGGTQAAGGAGATQGGAAGTLGTGGGNGYYAGGGGGGYYGGGAGYGGGGGGGGSSYTDAIAASAVTLTQGYKTGNGLVTITWSSIGCFSNAVLSNITVNLPAAPTANGATVNCGQTATVTAAGGGGNTYTWYSNAAASTQVGTGASFTSPALSGTTTYYLTSGNGAANGNVYTFTNCSATGQFGPTQAQVNAAYTATNLAGLVTSSSGIQLWTVPTSGTYRIEAFGAQGGGANNFGRGAQMRGDFTLTAGQQLKILVGQSGGVSQSGSGGGGSFVTTSANVPLIVAGGGGGQYDPSSALFNAHA